MIVKLWHVTYDSVEETSYDPTQTDAFYYVRRDSEDYFDDLLGAQKRLEEKLVGRLRDKAAELMRMKKEVKEREEGIQKIYARLTAVRKEIG